jgi:hypothetical protein
VSLANLDEISPRYLGEDRITLALAVDQEPMAGRPVSVTVDYAKAAPAGVELPLELVIQGSAPESYQRRVFRHLAPAALTFRPREGGPHAVILRELGHNRWWGRVRIDVAGERLERST